MSNYVILIDENGQPYIAHSVFTKVRDTAHKYIAKVINKGKARYFYDRGEYEAYTKSSPGETASSTGRPSDRFQGRKKYYGEPSGNTHKRGEGLDSGPVGVGVASLSRKGQEYVEALESLRQLQDARKRTKASLKNISSSAKAISKYTARRAFEKLHNVPQFYSTPAPEFEYELLKTSVKNFPKTFAKQLKLSGKALSEISDFASIVIRERAQKIISKYSKTKLGSLFKRK